MGLFGHDRLVPHDARRWEGFSGHTGYAEEGTEDGITEAHVSMLRVGFNAVLTSARGQELRRSRLSSTVRGLPVLEGATQNAISAPISLPSSWMDGTMATWQLQP